MRERVQVSVESIDRQHRTPRATKRSTIFGGPMSIRRDPLSARTYRSWPRQDGPAHRLNVAGNHHCQFRAARAMVSSVVSCVKRNGSSRGTLVQGKAWSGYLRAADRKNGSTVRRDSSDVRAVHVEGSSTHRSLQGPSCRIPRPWAFPVVPEVGRRSAADNHICVSDYGRRRAPAPTAHRMRFLVPARNRARRMLVSAGYLQHGKNVGDRLLEAPALDRGHPTE